MCFYLQQKETITKMKSRFSADVRQPEFFLQSERINGFAHLNVPVITNNDSSLIETQYFWGLLPDWAEKDFRKNTLNARIETVSQKPSFKDYLDNRCLIIATAFYEWRWLDEKGKDKQQFQINGPTEIITFAGLYNQWIDASNGETINTFTMLTTEANDTMQYVHNHKKRMPVMLHQEDENKWLKGEISPADIAFPYSANLVAFPIE